VDLNELRETVYRAVENTNQSSKSFHNLFERNILERWLYGRITNDELVEHSRFTGYNVSYFTQCFKKQVCLSPSQYRQTLQSKE